MDSLLELTSDYYSCFCPVSLLSMLPPIDVSSCIIIYIKRINDKIIYVQLKKKLI